MFDAPTLLAYSLAATALVLAPGPGQALVLARSVEYGWQAGLVTSLGLNVGTLAHTAAAALGLSAILSSSATAYEAVKLAGALYLVVLGIRAWTTRRGAQAAVRSTPGRRLFGHAAVTGILNPKVAVFFLAFLPQFVRPEHGAVFLQFMTLGVLLGTIGFFWDVVLATSAGALRHRLVQNERFLRWRERVSGSVMILLGARLALAADKS